MRSLAPRQVITKVLSSFEVLVVVVYLCRVSCASICT